MSACPYRIWDKVDGDFSVELNTTFVKGYVGDEENSVIGDDMDKRLKEAFSDRPEDDSVTLDEIHNFVTGVIGCEPFTLNVHYEMGLWGLVLQKCSDEGGGHTWIVHGVTKGYA